MKGEPPNGIKIMLLTTANGACVLVVAFEFLLNWGRCSMLISCFHLHIISINDMCMRSITVAFFSEYLAK